MDDFNFHDIDSLSLQELGGETELIPLMTPEDEESIKRETLPDELPILPLRNMVLFPGVVVPISVGRDKSIRLINETNKSSKVIGVASQKSEDVEEPGVEDINPIGTVARILRVLKMPDGNITVIIQGIKRFRIEDIVATKPYIRARISEVTETKPVKNKREFKATIDSIKDLAVQIIEESPNIPTEATFAIKNIESNSFLINFVSSNLNIPVGEKQKLLEINSLEKRATETLRYMDVELQKLSLKNDIQSKVRSDIDQQQREYFLHQQIKTIQEELGGRSYEAEIEDMRARAKKKKWGEETAKHFGKELTKLQRMNPQAPDYSVQRNYLDLLLDLPWKKYSRDRFDLKRARRVLNRDHYGLDDVKKRIVEHLAVLKLRGDMKSPILCLYGPPGVGKTSLGKSVAEALGRKYVRMSLGGMRDESEIRGHRKTYIGAMPGRVIQNMKKAETSNPVFVLDEIDKLAIGSQGDPSSAMLEVLDPEQNTSFYDNFLEVGYDLSKVLFIATANSLGDIHPALRDRMEIIHLTGYATEEKIQIAKKHLLPKQLTEHGLDKKALSIGKRQYEKIIEGYTRESGVRGLEKQLAKLARHIAMKTVSGDTYNPKLTNGDIVDILGAPKLERDKYEHSSIPGVVTGLAWTRTGGDILFIESAVSKGKGTLTITGNLGKVMKESANIALKYIRTNAKSLGLDDDLIQKHQVHIHVPEGATPKDGPSAGIAMLTSLVSVFSGKKVRKNLAMTGEITLRGKVLPVGGIKEKILAAKRAGIKEIILCSTNRSDVEEIKADYIKGLKIHYVDKMEDVLGIALLSK